MSKMGQNIVQTNDAAGGAGSISSQLLGIATNGLGRYIDGRLSAKYPLGSFNETETVNAAGERKPSGAPQTGVSATDSVKGLLQNPMTLFLIVGTLIGVGAIVALRK